MSSTPELWPSFFPVDTPPTDTEAALGQAYRLVDSIPSSSSDFLSVYQLTPERNFSSLSMACGVSFHTDLEDARKTRQRFKPLREKRVSVGQLIPAHGVMQPTPAKEAPSHLTVWFYVNAEPHNSFVMDGET